ncbi:MAG: tRNA (N(6)-L-threonylcarbamoyladenosine(37)-C(2))-methylthiotransferase [Nanoarchaeota archaeon]|nr:tRNA (N(6)-L-threonylcarbamoyladenosine(37)-C(2))-methylthiotransferase [Nanoarchaeota archaeon]
MKNLFIKTYGCAQNQADSIIMQNLLLNKGCSFTSDEKQADIIIVNTCTVKEPTQSKILKYLHKWKDKRLIITGCLVTTNLKLLRNKFKAPLLGCDNVFDIVGVVSGAIRESIKPLKNSKINITLIQKNEVIEIVPVCSGCLGECTYCATRFARGELNSYPLKEVINHVRKALKRGVKEFWITAQDTGAYGLDKDSSIIELLEQILSIKGSFKIRLGMMNPQFADKYKKQLINLLNNPKMFKFVHLPVQSGSDKVLKLMKRKYSSKDYINLIDYLKNEIIGLTLATDIIVGFPGETSKDFNSTIHLVKKVKPDIINISRYWKRKGTTASLMKKQVSVEDVKKRVEELKKLHKEISYNINKEFLGRRFEVLIDEEGRGRTDSYKLVKMKGRLGEIVTAEITGFSSCSLIGKEL